MWGELPLKESLVYSGAIPTSGMLAIPIDLTDFHRDAEIEAGTVLGAQLGVEVFYSGAGRIGFNPVLVAEPGPVTSQPWWNGPLAPPWWNGADPGGIFEYLQSTVHVKRNVPFGQGFPEIPWTDLVDPGLFPDYYGQGAETPSIELVAGYDPDGPGVTPGTAAQGAFAGYEETYATGPLTMSRHLRFRTRNPGSGPGWPPPTHLALQFPQAVAWAYVGAGGVPEGQLINEGPSSYQGHAHYYPVEHDGGSLFNDGPGWGDAVWSSETAYGPTVFAPAPRYFSNHIGFYDTQVRIWRPATGTVKVWVLPPRVPPGGGPGPEPVVCPPRPPWPYAEHLTPGGGPRAAFRFR